MNEKRQRSATFGCVSLIAIFFVALAALGLAYQSKPTYTIDIGSRLDKPYVSGFNTREPDLNKLLSEHKSLDVQTYRWTGSQSRVDLPGIGSQNITVTLNLAAGPNPNRQFQVWVGANQVPLTYTVLPPPPDQAYHQVSFPVPANWFSDGSLHIKLVSKTFHTASDSRELGYALDWVRIEPQQTGFFPFVQPPSDNFLPLLLIAVLSVLIFFSIGIPTIYGLLGGLLIIGGLCYWLINDRLSLTELLQQNFNATLFFIWIIGWAAAAFGPRLYQTFGMVVTRRETGWLSGLMILQFVLLYAVMLHPQFASSDVGLDVHNLQRVEQGQLLFTTQLPNGLLQPYPPSFYILAQPLASITGSSDPALINLIELINAALQASGVFLIYYLSVLMRQLPRSVANRDIILREEMEHGWDVGTNWAGILAAGFYVTCAYIYLIFSQGNFTNLFGAWAFLLFVSVTAGTLSYFRLHRRQNRNLIASALVSQSVEKVTVILPTASGKIVHYRRHPSAVPVATSSFGASLFTESPFAPDLADDPDIDSDADDGDEEKPNLSQKFYNRFASFLGQNVWPRLLIALRYLLPLLLLVIVLTSHYGVFLFTNVFMVAVIAVLAIFGGRAGRRDALYLGVIYLVAFGLCFCAYYVHFTDVFVQQVSGVGSGSKAAKPAFDLSLALHHLYTDSRLDFGLLVIIAAIGGAVQWIVAWWQRNRQAQIGSKKSWLFAGHITPLDAFLIALFLTGLFFALLSEVIGLESRYQLYILPLIALTAGSLLGRVWRSNNVGAVMVAALFLFQLLTTVSFWLMRITYY